MSLKTMNEINRDFMSEKQKQNVVLRHKKTSVTTAGIIFYFSVFLIFVSVLTVNMEDMGLKPLLGYSSFIVVSNSMKDEIPKGSLIFVKSMNSKDLNRGDNIAFAQNKCTLVAHKIINIYENYSGKENRAFQTQGVNNIIPDSNIVDETDVIGKVIFVIKGIGATILFINEKAYIIMAFGLCVIIYLSADYKFRRRGRE